ncbi:acyl-CoA carboxylase epsilon subunit [Streptomyces sp. NPDC055189]
MTAPRGPLVVVAGNPTPEELAAVTVALLALVGRSGARASGGGASGAGAQEREVGRPPWVRHGRGYGRDGARSGRGL